MTCNSKYMTTDGQVVSCGFTSNHRIHEGALGEEWFTWRTEHEMYEKPSWLPPKEPENVVPTEAPKKITLLDVVDSWKLDYYEGSALMYFSRHREANGAEDIREAIRHLELLLERQYPNV
jgi:hypothetical protein